MDGFWATLEGCWAAHKRGFYGSPVNRWSTKRPPNGTKLDRRSTGAIPRPLGKPRAIPRKFNTRSQQRGKRGTPEDIGVPDCKTDNGENARMNETNTYAKGNAHDDMIKCNTQANDMAMAANTGRHLTHRIRGVTTLLH